MTRAAMVRLVIGLGSSLAGAACLLAFGWTFQGVGGALGCFLVGTIAGERAFARLASPEQRRADLEERTRAWPD